MNAMKKTAIEASNSRWRKTCRAQLRHRNHAVLIAGDLGDRRVPTRSGDFFPHRESKSPGPPISPPFIAGVRHLTASCGPSVYVSAPVATERTLILVKPDAFERRLTGEVIARFERKGLRLVALKLMEATEEIANVHYEEHTDKPFFGELVEFITGGPLVALVLEGHEAVVAARQLIGATNPLEAAPNSIRGAFGLEVQTNLVHGSDSPESAAREIGLFFPELS
jgi:nucleoside-diphosphate kinase